jgi:signal transduction histidine kinase
MVFSDVTLRKALEKQVTDISEREQRRIGQDLHDGVCQHLVSTAYACNMLSETLGEKRIPESEQAGEIYALIKEAILQIRSLARALHPIDLTGDGLPSALEELAQMVQDATGIQCRCIMDNAATVKDQSVGTDLFRIAQEAVNNAVKHSQASQIEIELQLTRDLLSLTVKDDGNGIRPGAKDRKGIGLATMNYRARRIGASLYVGPAPNGGTLVACSLRQAPGA